MKRVDLGLILCFFLLTSTFAKVNPIIKQGSPFMYHIGTCTIIIIPIVRTMIKHSILNAN